MSKPTYTAVVDVLKEKVRKNRGVGHEPGFKPSDVRNQASTGSGSGDLAHMAMLAQRQQAEQQAVDNVARQPEQQQATEELQEKIEQSIRLGAGTPKP